MTDIPFPTVPAALVERLQSLWPNRCPQLSQSDREIWIAVGRQEVITKLTHEYERQVQRQLGEKLV